MIYVIEESAICSNCVYGVAPVYARTFLQIRNESLGVKKVTKKTPKEFAPSIWILALDNVCQEFPFCSY